jgi:DNA-binding HxlR family transcriptional regulator
MHMPCAPDAQDSCRITGVLSLVGDKWTIQIVMALRERSSRFNELKRSVGAISQQMLTRTLRSLERDGMVERTVLPATPPRVEYALTALGHSLAGPVIELGRWAHTHVDEIRSNRDRFDSQSGVRAVTVSHMSESHMGERNS